MLLHSEQTRRIWILQIRCSASGGATCLPGQVLHTQQQIQEGSQSEYQRLPGAPRQRLAARAGGCSAAATITAPPVSSTVDRPQRPSPLAGSTAAAAQARGGSGRCSTPPAAQLRCGPVRRPRAARREAPGVPGLPRTPLPPEEREAPRSLAGTGGCNGHEQHSPPRQPPPRAAVTVQISRPRPRSQSPRKVSGTGGRRRACWEAGGARLGRRLGSERRNEAGGCAAVPLPAGAGSIATGPDTGEKQPPTPRGKPLPPRAAGDGRAWGVALLAALGGLQLPACLAGRSTARARPVPPPARGPGLARSGSRADVQGWLC